MDTFERFERAFYLEASGPDVILCNPPYGRTAGAERLECRFLRRCLDGLAPGGRGGCIVPEGLLARESREDVALRRRLVEEVCLQSVVLLPLSTFQPHASVRTALLSFRNRPPREGDRLRLVDLRRLAPGRDFGALLPLLDDWLARDGAGAPPEGCEVTEPGREALRENDYTLLPEPYHRLPAPEPEDPDALLARVRVLAGSWKALDGARAVQATFFGEESERPSREQQRLARELKDAVWRLLDALFERMISAGGCPERSGGELFRLRGGEDPETPLPPGPYLFFEGNGAARRVGRANTTVSPTVVVNRVGSNCGGVHWAQEPCWVGANAMLVDGWRAELEPETLLLLLRRARLGRFARGSGTPYITQKTVLSRRYPLPPPERQREAAGWVREALAFLRRLEED